MHIRLLVPIACSLSALLACSTPPSTPAEHQALDAPLAPLMLAETDPLPVRPCYVGTRNCVDLDARPFAPCLVTDKRCSPDGKFIPLESDNIPHRIVMKPYTIEPR